MQRYEYKNDKIYPWQNAGSRSIASYDPGIVAALYQEKSGIAFLIPAGILLLLFFLAGVKKPEQSHIYGKEGMVIVALAWILWSLFGAMPFTISGIIPITWMRFLRRFPDSQRQVPVF